MFENGRLITNAGVGGGVYVCVSDLERATQAIKWQGAAAFEFMRPVDLNIALGM